MYLEFFKLKEFPFAITCDERFFYESAIHAEALASMLYTLQQRKGMVLITGEVGAGKTFLGSMVASRLGPSALMAMVTYPPDSAKQLLRAIAEGFGLEMPRGADKLTLWRELEKLLEKLQRRRRLVGVLFDEVQDLPDEAMEEIRLLWNWERAGQRLLQIILVGQPELRDRLRDPRWESLRQRIVLSYHLGRLSAEDTGRYIGHRCGVAANGDSPLQFTPQAVWDIHVATKGTPRLINIVCDNALLTAYARGSHEISRRIVSEVVGELACLAPNASPPAPAAAGPTSGGETAPQATAAEAPIAPAEPVRAAEPEPAPADSELAAALRNEPGREIARKVYAIAQHGSEAHHMAVRVMVQEAVAAVRGERPYHGR